LFNDGVVFDSEVKNMSAFDETKQETNCESGEAEEVRRVFAALPFEQRVMTLFKVELDLVADVVENVASTISKTVDDLTKPFTDADPSTQTPTNSEEQPA
jgi:hypothetical protein